LAESGRQVARITSIVDHLRTFGRREETEMAEVNLADVLESTLLLLGERMRSRNIELERSDSSDLPPVWGNASQLEQVYINLF
jgi:C4-dicarboxylate-specific signal transduction histidine kinase